MRLLLFLLTFVATVASSTPFSASANPPGDPPNEYQLLRKIPASVLDRLTANAMPDSEGAMQLNRGHWTDIVYQRVAIPLIWVGAAESDRAKVDNGWKAIDLSLSHLQSDGSFDTAPGRTMNEAEMAFWIEAVTHAVVVLEQSPLASQYAQRIRSVVPSIRRNVAWLNNQDRLARLAKFDAPAVNRLIVDACAFAYASAVLHDPSLMHPANDFIRQALAKQREDGTLLEENGFDSSYQGVSVLHLTYFALLQPAANVRTALTAATNREVAAIGRSGRVDESQNTRTGGTHMVNGQPYAIDYTSVILGLYYSGLYTGDANVVDAAERVFTSVYHQSPNA